MSEKEGNNVGGSPFGALQFLLGERSLSVRGNDNADGTSPPTAVPPPSSHLAALLDCSHSPEVPKHVDPVSTTAATATPPSQQQRPAFTLSLVEAPIESVENEEYGGLDAVASRDISAGEPVLTTAPYCFTSMRLVQVCNRCFYVFPNHLTAKVAKSKEAHTETTVSRTMLHCPNHKSTKCPIVYCSQECLEADREYHVDLTRQCGAMAAITRYCEEHMNGQSHTEARNCLESVALWLVRGFAEIEQEWKRKAEEETEKDENTVEELFQETLSKALDQNEDDEEPERSSVEHLFLTIEAPCNETAGTKEKDEEPHPYTVLERYTPKALEPSFADALSMIPNLKDMDRKQLQIFKRAFTHYCSIQEEDEKSAVAAAAAAATKEPEAESGEQGTTTTERRRTTSTGIFPRVSEKHFTKMCCQDHCNGFALRVARSPAKHEITHTTCVYPSASVCNHSCAPNVGRLQMGRCVTLVALRDIEEGESINLCYVGRHFPDFQDRFERLSEVFKFECQCDLCSEEEDQPTKGWCPACLVSTVADPLLRKLVPNIPKIEGTAAAAAAATSSKKPKVPQRCLMCHETK